MGAQLDTSGYVAQPVKGRSEPTYIAWPHLTPFCQGYTAPILEAADAPFHRLAPATLARIIEDCKGLRLVFTVVPDDQWSREDVARRSGTAIWAARQRGQYGSFPPLTVTLGDDGLIYFREAA